MNFFNEWKFCVFTISRSLPTEINIWKGHKNKGEV
jgi:hypothetical protein